MMEDKYCLGCGVVLQDSNILSPGYTVDLSNDYCSRCFKLKNYGEYQISTKNNEEYIEILKSVNDTKDLVLYLVDLLNIEKDLNDIRKYISNRIILVLTKRDVLPLSINDDKIKDYFKKSGLDYEDIILISSNKNYNLDELFLMIKKHKSSKNVYVVGHTNAGKSALINKIITNYSDNKRELTVSSLPSTTLNKIVIEVSDDLTIIDTPGLVDIGNISNYIDPKELKIIHPKKEIKPITHQVKEDQSILVGTYLRVDYLEGNRNSLTFFMSNDIDIEKVSINNERLLDLSSKDIDVFYNEDVVINGLGFIKVMEKCKIRVYVNKEVEVFTRNALI